MKLKLYIRPHGRGLVLCDENWELLGSDKKPRDFDLWLIQQMRNITGETYPPDFVEIEIASVKPGPRKE